jgi:hypothetical protein
MIDKASRGSAELAEERRQFGRDQAPAQAVANEDHGALHRDAPLLWPVFTGSGIARQDGAA